MRRFKHHPHGGDHRTHRLRARAILAIEIPGPAREPVPAAALVSAPGRYLSPEGEFCVSARDDELPSAILFVGRHPVGLIMDAAIGHGDQGDAAEVRMRYAANKHVLVQKSYTE